MVFHTDEEKTTENDSGPIIRQIVARQFDFSDEAF